VQEALAVVDPDLGEKPYPVVGDLDGDGEADLAYMYEGWRDHHTFDPLEFRVERGPFWGRRDSTAADAYAVAGIADLGPYLSVCDWNGDGQDDLMSGGGSWAANVGMEGPIPSGSFDREEAADWRYGDGSGQDSGCLPDMDGDGVDDAYFEGKFGLELYSGLSLRGTVGAETAFAYGVAWVSRIWPAGDLNADGAQDLFATIADYDGLPLLLGPFSGQVDLEHPSATLWVPSVMNAGRLGDLNGDGVDDAYVAWPQSRDADGVVEHFGRVTLLFGGAFH